MLEDGEKEAKSFSVGYCHPGHELARTYAVNPTTRSHAQFYAKTLAIALLTDASYLKSLEDDIMQNNRLKDSPVDKHVEDEKKKKKAAR
ncbi:hypothetical protein KZL06_004178 [Salmonella enterica subsp. enterica serovar Teshie]|uniref:Uncharacterized protein n=1 Tax=Salmonella enterica TaxID=28901 RepID=A0A763SSK7_SALER|nr:hypothetical protein [Salmonella enterica]EBR9808855.1 hypothetical protein [Salmonella enterica subsp. enterica serovar Teshie]ECD6618271.1 hypothetical protein [Salmonella enterica subsp. enterica]EBA4958791.1 hypothetical protein [Salmonella enterica]EBU9729242.1 hypothetical protein [Salmonella enterica subsp. enterica serovar Teshie]EBV3611281.1 hypothetical protein [Salmonella enterica subsp. enterica serovar Teshie]